MPSDITKIIPNPHFKGQLDPFLPLYLRFQLLVCKTKQLTAFVLSPTHFTKKCQKSKPTHKKGYKQRKTKGLYCFCNDYLRNRSDQQPLDNTGHRFVFFLKFPQDSVIRPADRSEERGVMQLQGQGKWVECRAASLEHLPHLLQQPDKCKFNPL